MPIVLILPFCRVTVASPLISCTAPMGDTSFVPIPAFAYSFPPLVNDCTRSGVKVMPSGATKFGVGSAV